MIIIAKIHPNNCAKAVANPAPKTPHSGKGPIPKINKGDNIAFMALALIRIIIGIKELPDDLIIELTWKIIKLKGIPKIITDK